jgi:hypothetical protein
VKYVICTDRPQAVLDEVVSRLRRESNGFAVRADHTTGRDKRDLQTQSKYATRLAMFFEAIEISSPEKGKP